jgi:hypothetical protein
MMHPTRWIPCLLIVILGGLCLVSERIPICNGTGYDGSMYADFIRNLDGYLADRTIGAYYVDRILPIWIVRQALITLDLPLSDGNVIGAFLVLNTLLLALSAFALGRIARRLQLSEAGTVLLSGALFINFLVLKMGFYYPVLMDLIGFCLALLILDAHLAGRHLALMALTIGGSFCWPTTWIIGLPLILFPSRPVISDDPAEAGKPPQFSWLAAGLIGAGFLAFLLPRIGKFWDQPPENAVPLIKMMVPISLLASVAWVTLSLGKLGTGGVVALRHRCRALITTSSACRFLVALAGFLVLRERIGRRFCASPGCYERVLDYLAFFAISRPLGYLLAHAIYFGPIVLLAVWQWRRLCSCLGILSPGMLIVAAAAIVLGLDAESRHLVQFFAVLAPFAVLVLDRETAAPALVWAYLPLAAFASKVWMSFNAREDLKFYFLNHGPWIGNREYVIQGILAVVILAVLLGRCRKSVPRQHKSLQASPSNQQPLAA